MIIIKHTKTGDMAFVSHVDCMRVLQRSLFRAGVEIAYSDGFNPHPQTFCSHPLPLGVESECEYLTVDNLSGSADEILEAFNNNSPDGIEGLYCLEVMRNPNPAGKVAVSDYVIDCDLRELKEELEGLAKRDSLIISFNHKGENVSKDIADMLLEIEVGERTRLRLATGNPTLRPDRLIEYFNKEYSLNIGVNSIKRVCQYALEDGKTVDMDEYIKRFAV